MSIYDFVEIGTSDFDTEIQKANNNIKGLSIDPIKYYLDRLPQLKNCQKIEAAVSNKNGICQVYYIPENKIKEFRLPEWLRGCNSINSYHPTGLNIIKNMGLDPHKIFEIKNVEMISFSTLVNRYNIEGIIYLKIDTEGHDTVILSDYYDLVENKPWLRAHKILFESNILTNRNDLTDILDKLFSLGYILEYSNEDTVITLPLDRIYHRIPLDYYYLSNYPVGYDHNNPPHDQTLESALNYAEYINAGGVTLEDGKYTVRAKTTLKYFYRDKLKSWLLTYKQQNIEDVIYEPSTVFVLLCDEKYFEKAKKTIIDLRAIGQWYGDIVLITVDFNVPNSFLDLYRVENKKVSHINTDNLTRQWQTHPIKSMDDNRHVDKLVQWDKLYLFDSWVTKWDRAIYIDCGYYILENVKCLLELPYKNHIYSHDDSYPQFKDKSVDNGKRFKCQLDLIANPEITNKIQINFGENILEQRYFQNGLFIYDTSIVNICSMKEMEKGMNEYPICLTNEMAIMNMYLHFKHKLWKPLPRTYGKKALVAWSDQDSPGTKWQDYYFIKYPVTIK